MGRRGPLDDTQKKSQFWQDIISIACQNLKKIAILARYNFDSLLDENKLLCIGWRVLQKVGFSFCRDKACLASWGRHLVIDGFAVFGQRTRCPYFDAIYTFVTASTK